MNNILSVTDKDEITRVSLTVMHSLPQWFSPPEDIDKKAILHREYPFFAVYDNEKPIGFLALKIHNKYTAEIFNMGVLEPYHKKGIGGALIKQAQTYCSVHDYNYLTVKTLDDSVVYEPYEGTRKFYRKNGFAPLEVFTTYWDEENPCLFLAKYIRNIP